MPRAFGGDRMITPRQAAGISVIVTYSGVFRPVALTAFVALREIRDQGLAGDSAVAASESNRPQPIPSPLPDLLEIQMLGHSVVHDVAMTKLGTQNIICRPNETGNRLRPGAIDSASGHCPFHPPWP